MKKLLSNFILAPLAIALAAGSLSAAPIKMSGSDLIGEKIEKELKARELPCLDYFMENFLPGFLLTLDEMEGLD